MSTLSLLAISLLAPLSLLCSLCFACISDYEEYALVQEYIDHQIPLDILVTDMDWHATFYSQADAGVKDQAGQTIGWTGFTFDQHLFPNTTTFFAW